MNIQKCTKQDTREYFNNVIQLSIVIPHYNTPELLRKLLESIPNDNDIQVVVVDDNSSVNMEEIVSYIRKRENVQYHVNDTKKKGAGVCRNRGMQACCGKWLLFADADDFFIEGWIDYVRKYYDSKYDLIFFTPYGMDIETGEESNRHLYYKRLIQKFLNNSSNKNLIRLKTGFCTPWSKMYKRDNIINHDITFSETMVSNDIMFTTKAALCANYIVALEVVIYCVTRSGDTLTTKKAYSDFWVRSEIVRERYLYVQNILKGKEFKYAQMNKYIIERFVSCVLEKRGLKSLIEHCKLYSNCGIKIITLDLFNPVDLLEVFSAKMKIWQEINKKQRK